MLKSIENEINNQETFDNNINIILNQTNYDKETAIEKLKQWNNDYTNVIREYLNPNFKEKKETKKKSTNQIMMTEIRNLLNSIENNNISIYNTK